MRARGDDFIQRHRCFFDSPIQPTLNTLIAVNACSPTRTAPACSWVRDTRLRLRASKNQLAVLARREFYGFARRALCGRSEPSSGLLVVLLALQLCRDVRLYGFGAPPPPPPTLPLSICVPTPYAAFGLRTFEQRRLQERVAALGAVAALRDCRSSSFDVAGPHSLASGSPF